MNVGTAQLKITPEPGLDLAGFAIRPQPSTGILDPLWIRALYLEDGPETLLWLHADLLALDQTLADQWRHRLARGLGVPFTRILLSASHTHSGPATIQLTGCGQVQPNYVAWLEQQVHCAADAALQNLEPCRVLNFHGACDLGIDRRQSDSAHTDPRVGVVAWQRADETFKAIFLTYGMHPVCLRSSLISGDWPGEVARSIQESLPGNPVTLVSSGACGNINPPGVGVTPDQMRAWSRQVSESISPMLISRSAQNHSKGAQPPLRVMATAVPLPIEPCELRELNQYVTECLTDPRGAHEFGAKFSLAVETWRTTMTERIQRGQPPETRAEIMALTLGDSVVLTVNAEVFSRFGDLVSLQAKAPHPVLHTVNCANGMIGYVPTAEAYAEGTYEVLWSMLFYNMPRPKKGGLELLAKTARQLIA